MVLDDFYTASTDVLIIIEGLIPESITPILQTSGSSIYTSINIRSYSDVALVRFTSSGATNYVYTGFSATFTSGKALVGTTLLRCYLHSYNYVIFD